MLSNDKLIGFISIFPNDCDECINLTPWYATMYVKFEFYKDPIEIDMQKNRICLDQGYTYNIIMVLKFDRHYKIFFENNSSIIVEENDVNIVQNDDKMLVSSNKFEYFKEISKIVSVRTEEGVGLLTKEYEKINFIEVDGYYFHREGTKQQERDNIKDKILYKYDIPLIRLNTTGSGEKEILENKIKEIFG